MTDRDRLDLLHRMSTNDLNSLAPGQGCVTVLTTALARIIDRVIVYHRGETALMVANYPQTVRNWLQRHIFWQDRVRMRDVSAELGQLELHGPAAGEIVARIAGQPVDDLALHSFVEVAYPDAPILIARAIPFAGEAFTVMAPAAAIEGLRAEIAGQGAEMGDEARYELMRIEAGQPGANHELTEEYIPLEAGLWDAVSFSKGCYIGQEIIARMESRNKLARTLVRLDLSNLAPPGAQLQLPDAAGGVGALTSAAARPDGSAVGLGFVKTDAAAPGGALRVMVEGSQVAMAYIAAVAERG